MSKKAAKKQPIEIDFVKESWGSPLSLISITLKMLAKCTDF